MNLLQTITFTLFSGVLNGSLIPNLFPSKTLLLNDYSHVDTTHSKEPSCDYKQLISGLGLPESEIDTIKYNKYAVPRATMRNFTRRWRKSSDKNINKCTNTKSLASTSCTPCCETVFTADVPYTVYYNSRTYTVVHPPDGYQVIFQGICQRGTSCSYGRCEEENNYFTWILVEDTSLNYYPQIKFVPVQYSKMCTCVNVGSR